MGKGNKTALYRIYGSDNRLLYVGISISAFRRLATHRKDKDWFRDCSNITLEWHESRASALSAEREAIRSESPAFNAVHNGTCAESLDDQEAHRLRMDIGARLYDSLNEWGSKGRLAQRLGVCPTTISRWFDRGVPPAWVTLVEVCDEVGVSSDWLLGLCDELDEDVA